jgi:hypothetical protein
MDEAIKPVVDTGRDAVGKDGQSCTSTGMTTLISGLALFEGLAVDSSNVYFVSGDKIMSCSICGCNNSPTTLAANQDLVEAMVSDGTTVFWTERLGGTVHP